MSDTPEPIDRADAERVRQMMRCLEWMALGIARLPQLERRLNAHATKALELAWSLGLAEGPPWHLTRAGAQVVHWFEQRDTLLKETWARAGRAPDDALLALFEDALTYRPPPHARPAALPAPHDPGWAARFMPALWDVQTLDATLEAIALGMTRLPLLAWRVGVPEPVAQHAVELGRWLGWVRPQAIYLHVSGHQYVREDLQREALLREQFERRALTRQLRAALATGLPPLEAACQLAAARDYAPEHQEPRARATLYLLTSLGLITPDAPIAPPDPERLPPPRPPRVMPSAEDDLFSGVSVEVLDPPSLVRGALDRLEIRTVRDLLELELESVGETPGVGAKKTQLLGELQARARRLDPPPRPPRQRALPERLRTQHIDLRAPWATTLVRLDTRCTSALERAEATTLGDVVALLERGELGQIQGIGARSAAQIEAHLERLATLGLDGYRFEGKPPPVEVSEAVARILAELPEEERRLIFMRYRDGLTLEEVGRAFGVTRQRIGQRQRRILEQARGPYGLHIERLLARLFDALDASHGVLTLGRALELSPGQEQPWELLFAFDVMGRDAAIRHQAIFTTRSAEACDALLAQLREALEATGLDALPGEQVRQIAREMGLRLDGDEDVAELATVWGVSLREDALLHNPWLGLSAEAAGLLATHAGPMDTTALLAALAAHTDARPDPERLERALAAHPDVYRAPDGAWLHAAHLPLPREELDAIARACIARLEGVAEAVSATVLREELAEEGVDVSALTPALLLEAMRKDERARVLPGTELVTHVDYAPDPSRRPAPPRALRLGDGRALPREALGLSAAMQQHVLTLAHEALPEGDALPLPALLTRLPALAPITFLRSLPDGLAVLQGLLLADPRHTIHPDGWAARAHGAHDALEIAALATITHHTALTRDALLDHLRARQPQTTREATLATCARLLDDGLLTERPGGLLMAPEISPQTIHALLAERPTLRDALADATLDLTPGQRHPEDLWWLAQLWLLARDAELLAHVASNLHHTRAQGTSTQVI